MSNETLLTSTIFKALTKKPSFIGVDYDYFFIESMCTMLLFIYINNFAILFIIIPLHLLGWILTQLDPFIFKIISVRASIGINKNNRFWACQAYEPF